MEELIKETTMKWVQTFVIDLALCPFASRSILEKKLSIRVVSGTDIKELLSELMLEIKKMDEQTEMESSLVIAPNTSKEFEDYLELLNQANELLKMSGYEGAYQLASFHPKYQFAGTSKDDPENYSNRSPYPIFHIIREDALSKAIDSYEGIESVPDKNIAKLNQLGLEKLQLLFQECNPHL